MKYALVSRTCAFALLTLFLFSGCKKDEFAEKWAGYYKGTAKEVFAGSNITTNYHTCIVTITEMNPTMMRIQIIPDPADGSHHYLYEQTINSNMNFSQTKSLGRGAASTFEGTLNKNQLFLKQEQEGTISDFLIEFSGKRN